MSIFAEVGSSLQQIGGDCPEGWVVMSTERPTIEHIASAEGQWIIPEPSIDIPSVITRRQGRLALIDVNKLLEVELFIESIEDQSERLKAKVEYEADKWERSNQWLNQMGELIGLAQEDIDKLFILAASKQ